MDTQARTPEIIAALDVEDRGEGLQLVEALSGTISFFKLGSRLFTAEGPGMAREIADRGGRVFLDLKFHDIPATVAGSVRAASALGVRMMTVHASGGLDMMRAAAEAAADEAAAAGTEPPLVVGVTVLTSLSREDFDATTPLAGDVADLVLRLARRAREAGLDGIVASVHEAARVRAEVGEGFTIVTPGIRPAGAATGDQKRVATPRAAAEAGSDYLVVGRPIYRAPDPAAAAAAILRELDGAPER